MRFLWSRGLVVAVGLLSVAPFALYPVIGLKWPATLPLLYAPILLSAGIGLAWTGAAAFRGLPWLATSFTAALSGMFAVGEAFRSAGLDVLVRGPLPWWSEVVAGGLVFAVPIVAAVSALSHLLARWGEA